MKNVGPLSKGEKILAPPLSEGEKNLATLKISAPRTKFCHFPMNWLSSMCKKNHGPLKFLVRNLRLNVHNVM